MAFKDEDYFSVSYDVENDVPESVPPKSILDLGPNECTGVGVAFFSASIFGSLINVFVLCVFIHKIFILKQQKSASDLLIAFLTLIDFLATAVLFPVESYNFTFHDKGCNNHYGKELFALTFFLETSSTLAMLNIAINRYVAICHVVTFEYTWSFGLKSCFFNVCLSCACTWLALYFIRTQQYSSEAAIIYISILLSILLLMVILYGLCYRSLSQRARKSKRRAKNKRSIERKYCSSGQTFQTTGGQTMTDRGLVATSSRYLDPKLKFDSNAHAATFKISIQSTTSSCATSEHQEKKASNTSLACPHLEHEEEVKNSNKTSHYVLPQNVTHGQTLTAQHSNASLSQVSSLMSLNENTRMCANENPTSLRGRQKRRQEKTEMQQMTLRSAQIFSIITIVYIVCFLPNAILTILLVIQGPGFVEDSKPTLVEILIRYVNLFYNFNFLVTPAIYAKLSSQFANDFQNLKWAIKRLKSKEHGHDRGTTPQKIVILTENQMLTPH